LQPVLVTLAMLASSCPVLAHGQADSYEETGIYDIYDDASEYAADAGEAEIVHEIEEMRDTQSKTYLLSDGQRQTVLYAVPVHYLYDRAGIKVHEAWQLFAKEQGQFLLCALWGLDGTNGAGRPGLGEGVRGAPGVRGA